MGSQNALNMTIRIDHAHGLPGVRRWSIGWMQDRQKEVSNTSSLS